MEVPRGSLKTTCSVWPEDHMQCMATTAGYCETSVLQHSHAVVHAPCCVLQRVEQAEHKCKMTEVLWLRYM